MEEAATLLRTSIVTIDRDRVDLDEDEAEAQPLVAADEVAVGDSISQVMDSMELDPSTAASNKASAPQEPSQTSASSSKIVLDASQYARMTKWIILKIQLHEKNTSEKGIRRSELVEQYLEENEDSMDSEEDLIRERATILRVINRLQKKVTKLLFAHVHTRLSL